MCDRVVILHHGRSIAAGPLDEVVAVDGVRLRVTNVADTGRAIAAPFGPAAVDGEWLSVRPFAADRIPELVAAIVAGGGRVHAVEPGRGSLESRFLELPRGPGRRAVIAIARLTVRELVRRRVVWVLAALTVVSIALVAWGLDRLIVLAREGGSTAVEIQIGVSQVLILIAFMFSFVLAMTAAFIGAPAIGGDLESGVAYAILARPLRRADVLVGRWLGSALVVTVYATASGLLAIAVAVIISGFGPPHPELAVAFLAGQALVLLTLTLALGSVLPSIAAGSIAVVAFGLGWMAGVLAGVATALGVSGLGPVAELSRWLFPSDGLWRGVIYGLEPPLVVLIAVGRAPGLIEANPFYADRTRRRSPSSAGRRCGSRWCSVARPGGSSVATSERDGQPR